MLGKSASALRLRDVVAWTFQAPMIAWRRKVYVARAATPPLSRRPVTRSTSNGPAIGFSGEPALPTPTGARRSRSGGLLARLLAGRDVARRIVPLRLRATMPKAAGTRAPSVAATSWRPS